MFNHDPISDLLTRIRNALGARHDKVDLPASKAKVALVEVLKDEGYIRNFKLIDGPYGGTLRVYLKYNSRGDSVIVGLQRVSKSGNRFYCGSTDVPSVLGGLGVAIMTTSKGWMSGDRAKNAGIGGEVVAQVW